MNGPQERLEVQCIMLNHMTTLKPRESINELNRNESYHYLSSWNTTCCTKFTLQENWGNTGYDVKCMLLKEK